VIADRGEASDALLGTDATIGIQAEESSSDGLQPSAADTSWREGMAGHAPRGRVGGAAHLPTLRTGMRGS
jgi:hypothetical protein